jgi:hypothetical protein
MKPANQKLARALVRIIGNRHGPDEAIGSADLARLTASNTRDVRRAVSHAFADGGPFILGATPGHRGGYYRVIDMEEALATHAWYGKLVKRAEHRLRAYANTCAAHGLKVNLAVDPADIIAKARAAQGKMSDRQFARTLGISHSSWAALKTGAYPAKNMSRVLAKIQAGVNGARK